MSKFLFFVDARILLKRSLLFYAPPPDIAFLKAGAGCEGDLDRCSYLHYKKTKRRSGSIYESCAQKADTAFIEKACKTESGCPRIA